MRCGTCGSSLYTNGTCPVCDRAPRSSRPPLALVELDVEAALLVAACDAELDGVDVGDRWAA